MRTRIKFCGFTRSEDAVFAAHLGVDAVGLVFYVKSPRFVPVSTAVEIVKALPAFVTTVGLFVNAEVAEVNGVLERVPLDCLQFHGDESPEFCRSFDRRYIKALRMRDDTDVYALAERYYDADALLLDAYHPNAHGGTGQRFDWNRVPSSSAVPVILAGGLDEMNAGLAVSQVKPYGIDVSSGIESAKGIKDNQRMADFVAAVMQSDSK
jgi:phosphoribosylanthranilate isomerase